MKTYGNVPSSLIEWLDAKFPNMINEVGRESPQEPDDSASYWVYLENGYINPDLEAHVYHETTIARVQAAMKRNPPAICHCKECN